MSLQCDTKHKIISVTAFGKVQAQLFKNKNYSFISLVLSEQTAYLM